MHFFAWNCTVCRQFLISCTFLETSWNGVRVDFDSYLLHVRYARVVTLRNEVIKREIVFALRVIYNSNNKL